MNTKIGELISQIRNQTKTVSQDNLYVSDRMVFSLIKKHASLFLYREDANMKLTGMRFLYTTLYMELIEVDKVEANCMGLRSSCTIKRTKNKLPVAMKGYTTPLFGEVSSVDQSQFLQMTTAAAYVRKMNASDARYNKTLYFWYMNGYLYFANIEWDAIRIEMILEEDVDECGLPDECTDAQLSDIFIPAHLMSTIANEVVRDLGVLFQIPPDTVNDKKSPSR